MSVSFFKLNRTFIAIVVLIASVFVTINASYAANNSSASVSNTTSTGANAVANAPGQGNEAINNSVDRGIQSGAKAASQGVNAAAGLSNSTGTTSAVSNAYNTTKNWVTGKRPPKPDCSNPPVQEASGRNTHAISFNPTPGDVSVVFLGNIFGSVDGVLAGSGSQIIGEMFGVFNAGLLSFGGIIILYTLMVSTLNTASEGQLMGQKWSSVMIPIRSAMGLSFLMPLASGYCAMQIIVMWIIMQGIGAADSIWSAALSYLNRGGVIVQKQINPSQSAAAGGGVIMNSAVGILAGQICMKTLELAYTSYKESTSGQTQCNTYDAKNKSSSPWYKFCNFPIPDFVGSVDITSNENLNTSTGKEVTQLMPFFPDDGTGTGIYQTLNGVCGQLSWSTYTPSTQDSMLTEKEQVTQKNSRTIAVHQMYTAMLTVSLAMVNNAPIFNKTIKCGEGNVTCVDTTFAENDFGYPLTASYGTGCADRFTPNQPYTSPQACTEWGTINQDIIIFNGKELQDAVAAYNGIMLPTLALNKLNGKGNHAVYNRWTNSWSCKKSTTQKEFNKAREFINEARNKGWLMAGAYFFRLALLNNMVSQKTGGSAAVTDTTSNLSFKGGLVTSPQAEAVEWNYTDIQDALSTYTNNSACANKTIAEPFCKLQSQAQTTGSLTTIGNLIVGNTLNTALPTFDKGLADMASFNNSYLNFNAVTYALNANSILLPDQAIILDAGLKDSDNLTFNASQSVPKLSKMKFSGGKFGMAGAASTLVWNGLLRPMWNMMMELMIPPLMGLFSMMLTPIITMSATIFNNALEVMRMEGINPIVSIAIMGTQFIDGIGNAWIAMAMYAAPSAIFPPGLALLMMLMPLVTTWMGIMLGVGFIAAYYVPFVPLLVFSFAAIGWFIAVIEAMTAAPIVALGAIHPEGNELFGKAEQALMLLLNMFLRPSLMIIGYIIGIILSYVGVWIMNAGFNMTIRDMSNLSPISQLTIVEDRTKSMYGFWTNVLLFYFVILTYATLYMSIAQQAFELIHYLPDKVLRWLSGFQGEDLGASTTKSLTGDVKSKMQEAADSSTAAMQKVTSSLEQSAGEEAQAIITEAKDKLMNLAGGTSDSGGGGGDSGGGDSGGGGSSGGDSGGGGGQAPPSG